MQFAAGTSVGPWTLLRPLGEGGNSEVWASVRNSGTELALKVLLDRRREAVPYQRFVREVNTLDRIGARADVLPLIDSHLPGQPSKRDRAWLAMPIAQPVRDALRGATLELVVEAVASFAETLTDLAAAFGIAHRDIKPGNLYRYDGHWAVGDFGLVQVPGAESLTESDRIVGPANFVAYEMMVAPQTADAQAADVYSLAKTFWVLATGQRWPPPGHQRANDANQAIGAYRVHPRTAPLDRLIDECTRVEAERPAMRDVGAELRAWQAASDRPPGDDIALDDVAARIRSQLNPQLVEEEIADNRLDAAQRSADRLSELLQPLIAAVEDAAPNAEHVPDDRFTQTLLLPPRAIGLPSVETYWPIGIRVVGPGRLPMAFRLLATVALLDSGQLHIAGAYSVARERVLGSLYNQHYGPWEARPGTVAAEQAIDELAREMREDLRPALEAFSGAMSE